MKCISWNVRGLRDVKRRRIVAKYLREWGATVVCLQETWLEKCETLDWRVVGGDLLEGYHAMKAMGR